MDYTPLGASGLKVSRIALGCMTFGAKSWRDWVMEEKQSLPFLAKAFALGINFLDTADIYSLGESERIVGKALKAHGRRDEVVVATKVFFPMSKDPNDRGLSRKHILAAADASLKRLGTDYIDLYQIHRFDKKTPIEETCEALDSLVRAGKVRYLGASSMEAWRFLKMLECQEANGFHRFVSMQNHYNLVYREEEREMIPLCRAEGVGLIPWSPLARGFLAGKSKDGEASSKRAKEDDFAHKLYYRAGDFKVVEALREVAAARGCSMAQIAYAWVMQQKGVAAPIIGVTKIEHLEDAVGAVDLALSDDEIARLEAPYEPHPVLGF